MLTFKHLGCVAIAGAFALALAIDAADARRGGGGGGMRGGGGGFSGGGMRGGGGFSGGGMRGGGAAIRGGGRAHVSNPIARPGPGNRGNWANRPGGPGRGNRPGYNPGWGYRPGYGWGAAAAAGAIGAGIAASIYYDPYYGGYGYYDEGAYAAAPGDPIAECARRFKTYDPASQTYVVRKGVRARCP
jgi:hypothetical protein